MKKPLLLILLLAFITGYTAKGQSLTVSLSTDTVDLGEDFTVTVIVQGGGPLTTVRYNFAQQSVQFGNTNDTLVFHFSYSTFGLIGMGDIVVTNGSMQQTEHMVIQYPPDCGFTIYDMPDTVLVGQQFITHYGSCQIIAGPIVDFGDGSPMHFVGSDDDYMYGFSHTYYNTGVYTVSSIHYLDTTTWPIVVVDTIQVPLTILSPAGGEVYNAQFSDTVTVNTALNGDMYYNILGSAGDTLAYGHEYPVWAAGNIKKFVIAWPNIAEANARLYVNMVQGNQIGFDTSNPFAIEKRSVHGRVYYDFDFSNAISQGDYIVPNPVFTVNPGTANMVSTQYNGYTLNNLQHTNVTYSLVNIPLGYTPTPAQYTVDMTNTATLTGYDFVIHPNGASINDLVLTMGRNSLAAGGLSTVMMSVFNAGTSASAPFTLTYTYNPSEITVSPILNPGTIGPNTVTINVPSIQPMWHQYYKFYTTITQPQGTLITESAAIAYTDDDNTNNSCINNFICNGAYDPNAITASPGVIFTPNNINPGYINYLVQFQNTGNGYAYNVKVTDTIAANLDMSTFEVVGSSKPVNTIIHNGNVIDFAFNNIMLPDSTADEPGSHGYVMYRIKPSGTLPLGSSTNAKVDIYFDYNPAVTTNTTSTVVMEPVGVKEDAATLFSIYPNPATNMVYIQPNASYQNDKLTLRIFSADGRLVREEVLQPKNQPAIDISKLPNGIYNLVLSNGKTVGGQKIVKN